MKSFLTITIAGLILFVTLLNAQEIIHDAEYTILEAQNSEQWAEDNKEVDKRLAELRNKNGGKPPNIVYILLDDVGFGEIGMDNWVKPMVVVTTCISMKDQHLNQW